MLGRNTGQGSQSHRTVVGRFEWDVLTLWNGSPPLPPNSTRTVAGEEEELHHWLPVANGVSRATAKGDFNWVEFWQGDCVEACVQLARGESQGTSCAFVR